MPGWVCEDPQSRCQAAWNGAHWCNERFEKLLLQGRSTGDFDTRKSIYAEIQQIVHEDGGTGVFMFPASNDIYVSSIGGTASDATNPFMGSRVAERAWFAA